MTVTVGGILIACSVLAAIGTAALTVLMAMATGMSDSTQDKFDWTLPRIGALIAAALFLVGRFSGL